MESISEMMRALGYYPSVQEIENMNNEIKYSKYENGQYVKELDLSMFVKLFVNHRPAYSIVKNQIEEALNTIVNSEENKESKQLTKERFLEILQKEGEKMSFMEIKGKISLIRLKFLTNYRMPKFSVRGRKSRGFIARFGRG